MTREKSSPDRRVAFAVDSRVRPFLVSIWALSVVVTAIFGGLAVLILQIVPQCELASGRWLFIALAVASFLLVVSALALSVLATLHIHRVTGAAYHIQQRLRRLGDGETPSGEEPFVSLRPGDYLQGLAAEVNRVALRLKDGAGG